MSRESLLKAVQFAGGQAKLVEGVRRYMPSDCKITQAYISQWLNPEKVKCEVPPPEYVIPIAQAVAWRITPHELRDDIYPHQTDGMPRTMLRHFGTSPECECDHHKEAA